MVHVSACDRDGLGHVGATEEGAVNHDDVHLVQGHTLAPALRQGRGLVIGGEYAFIVRAAEDREGRQVLLGVAALRGGVDEDGALGGPHDVSAPEVAVGAGRADATAFGYALGQIPRMPVDYSSSERAAARCDALAGLVNHPVRVGRIVSSDSFCTEQVAEPMRQRFPDAMGADMETCAIAQVAWNCGVDWISLRAVSDLCGPGADQAFHMDGERAAAHSAEAVRAYLALL